MSPGQERTLVECEAGNLPGEDWGKKGTSGYRSAGGLYLKVNDKGGGN